jgi:putative membrane protein
MRIAVILLLTAFAADCSRAGARADEAFNAPVFVATTMHSATSDVDLGVMAARRGRRPETRQLGAIMHHQESDMQRALAAIAQHKGLSVGPSIEPRQLALKENLDILPGEVFDRGYALAMLQDLNRLKASLERAARSNDPELAGFAKQYLPRINEQRNLASRLLSDLGGSPFA